MPVGTSFLCNMQNWAREFSIHCARQNMRLSALTLGLALTLTILTPMTAQAAGSIQPPRWVMVDDLLVRAGPGPEYQVTGKLSRGAEVILKTTVETNGYCLVEGDGQYGLVACKYLSAERIVRPKAGADGIDAAQRWVNGSGVTLREAPRPDSSVVGRLSLNSTVKLLREKAGSAYCEIQPASGARGYTACRYLALAPVVMNTLRSSDPERAFWLDPNWWSLEAYAQSLKAATTPTNPKDPWPRNDVLEKMKAHLALGLNGGRPKPYADWSELKRKAAQDFGLRGDAPLQTQGKNVRSDASLREDRLAETANQLQTAISIGGPLHDTISADGGKERVIHLVRALEFPSVLPSLFRSEAEIAPPSASAQDASGRFGIVYRQLVTPRPKPKPGEELGSGPGLYDMLTRTQTLVRPVKRIHLLRNGLLNVESSFLRQVETLWRDTDEPMCNEWAPGFAYGEADSSMWPALGVTVATVSNSNAKGQGRSKSDPAISMFSFYTNINFSGVASSRTETSMKMNRAETGFIKGSQLHYDLDGDGIADIAVWEGQGFGPGHLEGPTNTDDRWYRLALVNINGMWKVLGSDVFGYGCGC